MWLTHLDTEQQSDKQDGYWEKEEEHEEPGAPVEPVAEAHHPHVLLRRTNDEHRVKNQSVVLFLMVFHQWFNTLPSASSPSPAPQTVLCWGKCRWNWAPAEVAVGSEWPGWRHHTWKGGKETVTGPPWSVAAREQRWFCCTRAWWLGPLRAARPESPLGNNLQEESNKNI